MQSKTTTDKINNDIIREVDESIGYVNFYYICICLLCLTSIFIPMLEYLASKTIEDSKDEQEFKKNKKLKGDDDSLSDNDDDKDSKDDKDDKDEKQKLIEDNEFKENDLPNNV